MVLSHSMLPADNIRVPLHASGRVVCLALSLISHMHIKDKDTFVLIFDDWIKCSEAFVRHSI